MAHVRNRLPHTCVSLFLRFQKAPSFHDGMHIQLAPISTLHPEALWSIERISAANCALRFKDWAWASLALPSSCLWMGYPGT